MSKSQNFNEAVPEKLNASKDRKCSIVDGSSSQGKLPVEKMQQTESATVPVKLDNAASALKASRDRKGSVLVGGASLPVIPVKGSNVVETVTPDAPLKMEKESPSSVEKESEGVSPKTEEERRVRV